MLQGARVRYVDQPAASAPQRPDSARPESAVLLVHGFASSLDVWAGVRPALASRHRVLALDLKGFGWSDRPPGDYSPAAMARLAWALLDRQGVQRVALVGHSWGASVVLAMALQHPSRVRRVALYDAWVFDEQLPSFFRWARVGGVGEWLFGAFYKQRPVDRLEMAFYAPGRLPQRFVDHVLAMVDRPGTVRAALAAVRGQRYGAVQHLYSGVRAPTLLLWGRDDQVTPLFYGERLARALPNASLRVYPRCGHFPMMEAAAASTRDLRRFLAARDVGRRP